MKAIFFDFDGTLTYNTPNCWRELWRNLGYKNDYEKSQFAEYLQMFQTGKVSYQQWCNLTCSAYRSKGLHIELLNDITNQTKIIPNFQKFAKIMKKNNIEIHIVSGGIEYLIKNALKDAENIKSIKANKFLFDENGILAHIEATKYDFEGKATYITKLMQKNHWKPSEVCFVGDSYNDEFVYKTGCKTICINPDHTDFLNKQKWSVVYKNCTDITDILPEILQSKKQEKEMEL